MKKEYNKLHSRTTVLFRIISIQSNNVTIDEHGISNTVAIDRVTHAPAMGTQPADNKNLLETPTENLNYKPSTGDTEHSVSGIVQHIKKSKGVHYVVHWYGYGPVHDTVEPRENLPQYFITWNWRKIKKIGSLYPDHQELLKTNNT